jgi:hypothetical protein
MASRQRRPRTRWAAALPGPFGKTLRSAAAGEYPWRWRWPPCRLAITRSVRRCRTPRRGSKDGEGDGRGGETSLGEGARRQPGVEDPETTDPAKCAGRAGCSGAVDRRLSSGSGTTGGDGWRSLDTFHRGRPCQSFGIKRRGVAVRVGFEPTVPLRVQRFSRPPDSTTLAPHRTPM